MRTEYAVRQRASALVITLALLVLITILVVGFLARTQLDVISSRSHLQGVEAQTYTQMATDMAAAKICTVMGGSNHFWATGSGRIYASGSAASVVPVDLSSGSAPTNVSDDGGIDINPCAFSTNSPAPRVVVPEGTAMCLRWIYLRQDGSMDTNFPPPLNSANPVIGRFAYWVDDESTKININTAWTRSGNTNGIAHPSMVNLESFLTATDADAVRDFRTANHYFHGVPEIQTVNADLDAAVRTNRFSMTCYNMSAQNNIFGESKILLTTQQSNAIASGSTNFLDILAGANTDPGTIANLNANKVANSVSLIYDQLARTNWPFLPGKSFIDKYGESTVQQLCMNIVDYVRSAESTNTLVEPLRGNWTGRNFSLQNGSWIGNSRRVLITEVGAYVSTNYTMSGTKKLWTVKYKTRVHLPRYSGLDSVNLTNVIFYNAAVGGDRWIVPGDIEGGDSVLRAGEYRTIVRTQTNYANDARPTYLPSIQVALAASAANRYDVAYFVNSGGITKYPVDGPSVAESDIHSLGLDDPFLKYTGNAMPTRGDWVYGPNQFGSLVNPHHTSLPLADGPQQDFSSGGTLTDEGVHLPAPKGTSGNPVGLALSIAELGFIHSGMTPNVSSGANGTPWRTLRLQPQSDTNQLPDWALLDLFSVPVMGDTNNRYIQPYSTNSQPDLTRKGGLINVNNGVPTFVDENGKSLITNTLPLQALFLGATNGLDKTRAETLADNISRHVVSQKGASFGTNFYYLPGQIAEIEGVSDSGEASEGIFRQVIDLATTRGTVFSVYAVGQSLKQDPNGNIRVLGERRQVTLLECSSPNGGTKVRAISTHSLAP